MNALAYLSRESVIKDKHSSLYLQSISNKGQTLELIYLEHQQQRTSALADISRVSVINYKRFSLFVHTISN
jgi:hypothetical protein